MPTKEQWKQFHYPKPIDKPFNQRIYALIDVFSGAELVRGGKVLCRSVQKTKNFKTIIKRLN